MAKRNRQERICYVDFVLNSNVFNLDYLKFEGYSIPSAPSLAYSYPEDISKFRFVLRIKSATYSNYEGICAEITSIDRLMMALVGTAIIIDGWKPKTFVLTMANSNCTITEHQATATTQNEIEDMTQNNVIEHMGGGTEET